MLEETLGYYKSQLKSAAKSGPQFVTIESVIVPKTHESAWVVKFVNDNIEHEEYYSVKRGFGDLLNLLKILKSKDDVSEIIGKKLWIVIRHNITIDDKQNEVKREAEIVHYSVDEQMPNYPTVFEEYDIAAV